MLDNEYYSNGYYDALANVFASLEKHIAEMQVIIDDGHHLQKFESSHTLNVYSPRELKLMQMGMREFSEYLMHEQEKLVNKAVYA